MCCLRVGLFLIVALTMYGAGSPIGTDTDERQYQFFDITLERTCFDEITTNVLQLTDAQRLAIAPLYQTYLQSLRELGESTARSIEDAGARRRREIEMERSRRVINKPFDENDSDFDVNPPTAEEIELDRRSFEAMTAGVRASDQLLFALLADIKKQLNEDQLVAFARLPDLIRMYCFFHASPGANAGDFAVHPDMRVLFAEAMKPGCELAGVGADLVAQLLAIRDQYEPAMGSAIAQWAQPRRVSIAPSYIGKVIFMGDDSLGARELMRRTGEQWALAYDVNRAFVDEVHKLLASSGMVGEAERWLRRFRATYAPRLFDDDVADELPAWLRTRALSSPEQIEALDDRLAQHMSARERLRGEGFETLVARKRKGFSSSYPLSDPHRNDTGERLRVLQDGLLADLKSTLTPTQQSAMETFLANCVRGTYDVLQIPPGM